MLLLIILLGSTLSFGFRLIGSATSSSSPKAVVADAVCLAAATVLLLASPFQVIAADEEIAPVAPRITSTVNLNVKIAPSSSPRQITIGVFGNEAPLSSKVFLSLCGGENTWDVSLDGSQVSRIISNERIDVGKFSKGGSQKLESWMDSVGKVRLRNVNVAENTVNSDQNSLRHTSGGEVSMRKGGGSFDFTIAPGPNPKLDDSQVIIGKVIDGIEVISDINSVPTSREDVLGSKTAFSSAGKNFDGRAKLATLGKPLRKVTITTCAIDDKASLASFMKF
jgi:cyclophilin family peptidyl-prolyl cis-trans isomerase